MIDYTRDNSQELMDRLLALRRKFKGGFMRTDDVEACEAMYAELRARGVEV